MRTHLLVFAVAFLCAAQFISLNLSASKNPKATAEELMSAKGWSLIENIGQLNGATPEEAAFYGQYRGGTILFKQNEVAFYLSSPKGNAPVSEASGQPASNGEATKYTRSLIKLSFLGANEAVSIQAGEKQPQVYNYYLAHCPGGLHGAKAYRVITYKNIYPNIDLVFKSHDQGLKYEFLVHPGGDVKDIKMNWSGAQPNLAKDGGMIYSGLTHIIKEEAPVSYLASGESVASSFKKDGNTISFKVENYDKSEILTIDPLLMWGTYYGGTSGWGPETDIAVDIGVDGNGNIYIAGNTDSENDIATPGAYQEDYLYEFSHYYNMFITKFSADGQLVWGTYYGDTAIDVAHALEVDNENNIYMAGYTLSPYRLGSAGTHQPSNNVTSPHLQSYGGILVKFDSNGKRKWGTYFGGFNHDGFTDVVADEYGHVYAVGYTISDTLIGTPGLDTTYGGRHTTAIVYAGDAFITKFKSATGKLVWGTYFGGSRDDFAKSVGIDANGDLLVGGLTYSAGDIATTGAYQPNSANTSSSDIFIAKIDTGGNIIFGTYYGGTDNDVITAIRGDRKGNIIVAGYTWSDGLSTSGAVDDSREGVEGLITKFSSSGGRLWSTYYGGSSNDYIHYMDVDSLDKIYLQMATKSQGLATPDAYRDSLSHSSTSFDDIVILILDESGNRTYSTYYGGTGTEWAGGIAVDPLGAIYITGGTTSSTNISTRMTYRYNKHGVMDVFLVRFDSLGRCDGLYTEIKGDTVACADALTVYTTPFDVRNSNQWFVEGGQIAFGEYSDSMGVYWFGGQPGKLKVVAINEYECYDSSMIEVKVLPAPKSVFAASNTCVGDTLVFVNEDTSAVQWLWDFGDGTTSQDSLAEHAYAKVGFYTIRGTVWNSYGCSSMVERLINVTTVSAPWTATHQSGHTFVFSAADTFHTAYYWDFGDGYTDTGHTVMHTFAANGDYTVTLVVTSGFGCTALKDSIISSFMTAIAGAADLPIPSRFYPNPLSGQGWLEYELSSPAAVSVSMYDLAGREVMNRNEGMLRPGKYRLSIDASAYEPGMYYMVLKSDNKQSTQRILIK